MENNQPNNEIIIYQGESGELKIEVRLTGETVWLSQQQLVELYQSSRTNIVEHIKDIYDEGELDEALPVGISDMFALKATAR